MSLRRLLISVPVGALLTLMACTDQENPTFTKLPNDPAAGDGDGSGGPRPIVTKQLCMVKKAGDEGKVIKGKLLLPDRALDGELVIDKTGTITCAAKDCSGAPDYDSATRIECQNAVISPGLINPHDHISFANNGPHAPSTERYEHRHDWRKGARGHKKIPTGAPKVPNAVEAAELRFAMSGVTAIAGAGGAIGLVRNMDGAPAQQEGLDIPIADSDTFPLDDIDSVDFPTSCEQFKSSKRTTATSIAQLKGYLPHIAEGIDSSAHAEFVCQSGGGSEEGLEPRFNLISRQTAVVHGMAVTPPDVERYRANGAILVWSPRSNVDLYGNTAPIALYHNLGVPIALGTDWLPSGSMNMSRELACADYLNTNYFDKALSDKELWESVTVNAANAVGAQYALGQLRPGFVGDIAIFDATGKEKTPYRAVIEAGVEDTVLVLRGGKALYGDSALVKEPGSGGGDECEDITVCGVTKKACVKKDLGKISLADLQTAGKAIYPLYFCKDKSVDKEPSCLPTRGPTDKQPKVSTYKETTDTDKDGDGVPDARDNCPKIFNPIRPMDNGVQPDADSDGIGDACDKCPLEAGENCTVLTPDDMDGDGVPNIEDNCPEDPNPDQTDGDGDGKGAVCDTCDNIPNPGYALCSAVYTIAQLRKVKEPGHPASGSTRAIVKGVYVTAVKNEGSGTWGFFIQDGTDPYSGMFVAKKMDVKVGNKVDVEGNYEESYDLSQLSNAEVKIVDPGTTLPFEPVVLDPAVAVQKGDPGEAWETMLCAFEGPIAVSNENPDQVTPAPPVKDFDEFAVGAMSLRIDDNIWDRMDNNYPLGTTFSRIVGICGYSHGNRKIWPRSEADLVQAR